MIQLRRSVVKYGQPRPPLAGLFGSHMSARVENVRGLLVANGRLEAERDGHKGADRAAERTAAPLQRAVVAMHVAARRVHVRALLLVHIVVISCWNVNGTARNEAHTCRLQA